MAWLPTDEYKRHNSNGDKFFLEFLSWVHLTCILTSSINNQTYLSNTSCSRLFYRDLRQAFEHGRLLFLRHDHQNCTTEEHTTWTVWNCTFSAVPACRHNPPPPFNRFVVGSFSFLSPIHLEGLTRGESHRSGRRYLTWPLKSFLWNGSGVYISNSL